MKRSTPLRSDPAKVRDWLDRSRRPLAKVGRRKQRSASAEREFRRALKQRSGGMCEARVSPSCGGAGTDPHHKCPADRDRGQHDPARGMWLCRWCHGWVHAHPARSYEWGFLLRDDGGGAA